MRRRSPPLVYAPSSDVYEPSIAYDYNYDPAFSLRPINDGLDPYSDQYYNPPVPQSIQPMHARSYHTARPQKSPSPSPAPIPLLKSPSQEYISTSLEPSTHLADPTSARKLLILDLNGTLVFRSARNVREYRHHHHNTNNNNNNSKLGERPLRAVHPRPYLGSFTQFLFHAKTREWLDTMVWSSAQPHSVADMVHRCFGERKDGLVAVWARDTLGLSELDYHRKAQTTKDLAKPWAALPLPLPHSQLDLKAPRTNYNNNDNNYTGFHRLDASQLQSPLSPNRRTFQSAHTNAQNANANAQSAQTNAQTAHTNAQTVNFNVQTTNTQTTTTSQSHPFQSNSSSTSLSPSTTFTFQKHSPSPSISQTHKHSARTTLLLDDSPLKAQLQPWNHLCIREYVSEMRRVDVAVRDDEVRWGGGFGGGFGGRDVGVRGGGGGGGGGGFGDVGSVGGLGGVRDTEVGVVHPDVDLGLESAVVVDDMEANTDMKKKRKREKKMKKKALALAREQDPGSRKKKYDRTLLAVIGILDTIKVESNVAGWMHGGGLVRVRDEDVGMDVSLGLKDGDVGLEEGVDVGLEEDVDVDVWNGIEADGGVDSSSSSRESSIASSSVAESPTKKRRVSGEVRAGEHVGGDEVVGGENVDEGEDEMERPSSPVLAPSSQTVLPSPSSPPSSPPPFQEGPPLFQEGPPSFQEGPAAHLEKEGHHHQPTAGAVDAEPDVLAQAQAQARARARARTQSQPRTQASSGIPMSLSIVGPGPSLAREPGPLPAPGEHGSSPAPGESGPLPAGELGPSLAPGAPGSSPTHGPGSSPAHEPGFSPPPHEPELWFEDEATLEYWALKGEDALCELGIEVVSGVVGSHG